MLYFENDEVTIRDMTPADAQRFVEEERRQGWHASLDKYEEHFRSREAGKCVSLTAEFGGEPAGYVHIYPDAQAGPFAGRGFAEIVDFAVLEKYRRRGIGGLLMDAAEAVAARYAGTVYLAVGLHSGYGSAQRMYVKRGYIPDGTGAWYRGKPCTPYDTIWTNDDDLVLFLSKSF